MKVRDTEVQRLRIEAQQCLSIYNLVRERLRYGLPVEGKFIRLAIPAKRQFNSLMERLKQIDPSAPQFRL